MFDPILDLLLFFTLTTPIIGFVGKKFGHEDISGPYSSASFILALVLIPFCYQVILDGEIIVFGTANQDSPIGSSLVIDHLGLFMATIYLSIGAIVSLFGVFEIKKSKVQFQTIFLTLITGMIGVVFSGDLLTFFVFWEIMCLSSYALVAFRTERAESIEASYKYLIMSTVGSLTILFGLSYLYGMTGTLNIAYLAAGLRTATDNIWMSFTLALIIGGMGLQAGMFPFHMWLPDAHSAAPVSISAALSSIVVTTGIYGLLRLLIVVFNPLSVTWQTAVAVLAVFTMFTGNFLALLQDDIKRLLASSTIANIGYILLGISIRSEIAFTGSLLHILNHAVTKSMLFLSAGALIYGTKTRSLKKMAGVWHYMPTSSLFFLTAVLSLTGIPPLNMFWSELIIVSSGLQSEMMIYSLIMILNLSLTSVYCIRIIKTIALEKPTKTARESRETSRSQLIIISVLAGFLLIIGLFPGPFIDFAEKTARIALDYEKYINIIVEK